MKTIDIVAYKRTDLGKGSARQLRKKALLPCVLYGGKSHLHLYMNMAEANDFIYTPEVFFIKVKVGEAHYTCIVKDLQFHPVNGFPLHVDLLQIFDDKSIQMHIPIRSVGSSVGVAKGGALLKKVRKISVFALPKDIPAFIDVDVSGLDLGQTAKVKDVVAANYVIQENLSMPLITIGIPRALRSKVNEATKAE
ncbi:MAG: 50S ribosomal protein L25 [Bacteroidota bacterium]